MKENTPLRGEAPAAKSALALFGSDFLYYFWSVLADGQEKVMTFHCTARTEKIKVLVSAGNYLLLSRADKKHFSERRPGMRYVLPPIHLYI